MLKEVSSTPENDRTRHEQESSSASPKESDASVLSPEEYTILDAIQRRVLWLSTLMIHYANNVRSNPDDLKVGGHQASSASMVSILTALYFHYLDAGDRVSIKPHASPAYHAIQYLLGNLDQQLFATRCARSMGCRPIQAVQKIPIQLILAPDRLVLVQ